MAQKNSSEEVNMNSVMKQLEIFFNAILMGIYRGWQFLVRNSITIGILIIVGLVFGFFLDKNQSYKKEATLIVQINFEGGNQIYNTIEQIKEKITDRDSIFFKEIDLFENGKMIVEDIEISPIVNLQELWKKTPQNDRNVDLFLQQAQYENQILTSEIFIPQYRMHKIKLITSEDADESTLIKLIAYLNQNPFLQKSKDVIIENTQLKIKEHKLSISYIDSLSKNLGTNPSKTLANQVYVNTGGIDYFHLLLKEKGLIMAELESLEIELLKYGEPVVLLNQPVLYLKKVFLSNKMIVFPLLLVILFVLAAILIALFRKAKRLEESRI